MVTPNKNWSTIFPVSFGNDNKTNNLSIQRESLECVLRADGTSALNNTRTSRSLGGLLLFLDMEEPTDLFVKTWP